MSLVHRVLFPHPIKTLDEYLARGGGSGLEKALGMDAEALISEVEASGLRGRGGAGFPTGRKWRTVRENKAAVLASTVAVNGGEGEPGTFKDRTILRVIPYAVIEGALIAAKAVGADEIVFGLKKSFVTEVARLRDALAEVEGAGWADGIRLAVFEGPNEYLYGEETGLLETIDGRYPFPRIAPPYRRGDREVVESERDVSSRSGLSAHVEMAGPQSDSAAPPTLVDNVETLANIPRIIGRGAAWFRTEGTPESPGTIVCTVTGDVQRAGVGEVVMGTPLREVVEAISGGARPGRRIKAVLPGASGAFIKADQLDAPVSYEGLAAIGSGLGSGSFQVFDDTTDMVAVAAGAARFLAVESCGQCVPCKQDGLAISGLLSDLCRSNAPGAPGATGATGAVHAKLAALASTVADRARCSLATQQQVILQSLLRTFPNEVDAHARGEAEPVELRVIAELLDIDGTTAVIDERHMGKQPDWTYDAEWSRKVPAELHADNLQMPLED